jgi:spore coat polysaccharide biosynthesis protein SpsF (cytidylyltransferase family)
VEPADEAILSFAEAEGCLASAGSEQDVLDRIYRAASRFGVSVIVRVTPDCPMLDPEVSGRVLAEFRRLDGRVDYVSNVHPPTFPDGLDTEVFSRTALEVAWREGAPGVRPPARHPIHLAPARALPTRQRRERQRPSLLRWMVDVGRPGLARAVYGRSRIRAASSMDQVLQLLESRPELRLLNAGQRRNEGLERSLAAGAAPP